MASGEAAGWKDTPGVHELSNCFVFGASGVVLYMRCHPGEVCPLHGRMHAQRSDYKQRHVVKSNFFKQIDKPHPD